MEAIRPDVFMSQQVQEEQEETPTVTPDELSLFSLSKSRGWKVFKRLSEEIMTELELTNKEAIANGAPLEEIGKNAVVLSLVQGVIDRLMNKVSDAAEACNNDEENA